VQICTRRFASDEIEIRRREDGRAGEGRERHRRAGAGAVREASYVATTSEDIDLK
jgi:hypothetical protein